MSNNIIDSALFAEIILIAALGLWILVKLCGRISLSQGSLLGCSAVVSSYLLNEVFKDASWSALVALLASVVIVGIISALQGAIVSFFNQKIAVLISIVFNVLTIYILKSINSLSSSGVVLAPKKIEIGKTDFNDLKIGEHIFSRQAGLLILTSIILLAAIAYARNIFCSPLSRAMRAVKDGEHDVESVAISYRKTIIYSYLVCGVFAGLSGFLYMFYMHKVDLEESTFMNGSFGIVASIIILLLAYLTSSKRLSIAVISIFVLSFLISFLIKELPTDIVVIKHITPTQISTFLVSLIAILFVLVSARLVKSKV
ncbi:MAG: hypothetical protein U0R17_03210 [Acidimicrobiia bacterium]